MLGILNKLLILALVVFLFIARRFIVSLPSLIYWWVMDIVHYDRNLFREYGLRLYCGRQGSGKTIGIVYDLEYYRRRYPKLKIYTNFGYIHQTAPLKSLNDLLNPDLLNGTDGVIFAIDEIQNEFSSASSRDFPETLLSQITQQRKQRICILASSQVFLRIAKPLREQSFIIVECKTIFGRYTKLKYIDADDYIEYAENPLPKKRLKLRRRNLKTFVQTDSLRSCYDSYELIKRLSRVGFAPKVQDNNITVNNVTKIVHRK